MAWTRHTILSGLNGADGVRFAPMKGDGQLYALVPFETAAVWTISGPVQPTFPWTLRMKRGQYAGIEGAVPVDFDGTGLLGVAACCELPSKQITFSFPPPNPADYFVKALWTGGAVPAAANRLWMDGAPAQIDGANGVDLFVGAKATDAGYTNGTLAWLKSPTNPRTLSAWTMPLIRPVGWPMYLGAHDMNGNGIVDLVASDRQGPTRGVWWHENNGDGSLWTPHLIGGAGLECMFAAVVDFDGDGLDDVLCVLFTGEVLWFKRLDSTGLAWQTITIPAPTGCGSGKGIAVGDIDTTDGTGPKSIVLSHANATGKIGVVALRHDGSFGNWTQETIATDGEKYDQPVLIDLTGNGKLDVVVTEEKTGPLNQGPGLGVVCYENPN